MTAATRAVFDCNVFLQALSKPGGPAGNCVQMAFDGTVALFISPTVISELCGVSSRPGVIKKLGLVKENVERFIQAVEIAATILDRFDESFVYDRDPSDAHYINLAVAAGASLVVSRDRDLLDLMTAADSLSIRFRADYSNLTIVTPVEFLKTLRSVDLQG